MPKVTQSRPIDFSATSEVILTSNALIRLTQAFSQLKNAKLRQCVVNLVEEIAESKQSTREDPESFLRKAEECFRDARTPGVNEKIAEGLEVAGNEYMAKAVEIETERQRKKHKK